MLMWLHVVMILRRRGTNINESGNQRRNDLVAPGGGLVPVSLGRTIETIMDPSNVPEARLTRST